MSKISFIVLTGFCFQSLLAGTGPPPPPAPQPPGFPIDGFLVVLVFIALITGYYLSQKYILNKKGSL